MEEVIENIIKHKIPCYFISPHLDDAFLSAGDLISHLGKRTHVTVLNIFTKASPAPYTLAAKGFLRYCGVKDADELFKIRKEEDKKVCKMAKVDSVYLDFVDGTWRKKRNPRYVTRILGNTFPEFMHLYPLGRKLIHLAHDDLILKEEISKQIKKVITDKKYIVFCPLGTVRHMDHTITRNVCTDLFPDVIFWNDFPYIQKLDYKNNFLDKFQLQQTIWHQNLKEKNTGRAI